MAEKELIFRIVPEYDAVAGREAFDAFTRAAAEANEKVNRLGRFGPAGFSGGSAPSGGGGTLTAPVHNDAIRGVRDHADAYRKLGEEAHRTHTSIVTQTQHVAHGMHKTLKGVEQLARGITLLGLSGEADLGKLVHKLAQFEGIVATLKGVSSIGSGLRRSGMLGSIGFGGGADPTPLTSQFSSMGGAMGAAGAAQLARNVIAANAASSPITSQFSGIGGAMGAQAAATATAQTAGAIGTAEIAGIVGVIVLVGGALKVFHENLVSLNNYLSGSTPTKGYDPWSAENPNSLSSIIGNRQNKFSSFMMDTGQSVADKAGMGGAWDYARWASPFFYMGDDSRVKQKTGRAAEERGVQVLARQMRDKLDQESEGLTQQSRNISVGGFMRTGNRAGLEGMIQEARASVASASAGDLESQSKGLTEQLSLQKDYAKMLASEEEKRQATMSATIAKQKDILTAMKGQLDIQREVARDADNAGRSAKERFGAMSNQEQGRIRRIVAKARAGGSLTRQEADEISKLGTVTSDMYASQARQESADRGKWNELRLDENEQLLGAESRAAASGTEIGIKVQRDLVVKLETDNKAMTERMKSVIEALNAANDELEMSLVNLAKAIVEGRRERVEEVAREESKQAAGGKH